MEKRLLRGETLAIAVSNSDLRVLYRDSHSRSSCSMFSSRVSAAVL
jgi:hypothetical protein